MLKRPAHVRTLLILLFIVALLGFITYSRLSPNGLLSDLQNDLKLIQPGEGTMYTDLSGNPIDLESFKGKPLIVNAWATWMPFSKDELGLLGRVAEKYGDQISVLAMNRMEDRAVIAAYLEAYPESSSLIMASDPADTFYRAVGGYAMPETVFYRRDGTILLHKRGVLSEEELESAVAALLSQAD